jgi:hypothetical protein
MRSTSQSRSSGFNYGRALIGVVGVFIVLAIMDIAIMDTNLTLLAIFGGETGLVSSVLIYKKIRS